MYDWKKDDATYDIKPPVRDPQIINGKLLASLDRSTMYDFCTKAKMESIAHQIELEGNTVIAMPRNTRVPLPQLEVARAASRILLASRGELRDLLLNAGILYRMTDEEEKHLGVECLLERERSDGQRLAKFTRFREALGISEDFQCGEPLFIS